MFRVVTDSEDLLRVYCVRCIVFVGEQACPFDMEFDGLDATAIHILGEQDDEPIAVGRIRDTGGAAKLERIAVMPSARGAGLGHRLVEFMLEVARARGFRRFEMHAQAHLGGFYAQHGFERRGDLFVEAGIDHFRMVREDGLRDGARPPGGAP